MKLLIFIGYDTATDDSGDDIDSIHSDFYESALEQVEGKFCEFNAEAINIVAPSSWTDGDAQMFFEKKAFHYWLDDGVVEISVERTTGGEWRTMDNNLSAKGIFYKTTNISDKKQISSRHALRFV